MESRLQGPDKNGMMTQKTVDGTVTGYSYDAAGRLTEAGIESYSYDTAGNRLVDTAIYDSKTNQLSQTATFRYEYDAFGNLTKKTDKASGDYKVYTWNVWDQLTKAESLDSENNSVKKLEFTYGALGRRLLKKVEGTTKKYLYSGSNMIAVMNVYSTLYQRIIHDEAIDSPLSIVDVQNSESYYYHKDHLGSITGLSNSGQNSVEAYTYDAYGQTVKSSSVETGNTFAYTGREMDDDDLYYYRARYYDPTVGRFLSEDPIGFVSGDFNFYRYVLNNPINFVDPFGFEFNYYELLEDAGTDALLTGTASGLGSLASGPFSIPAALIGGAVGGLYGIGSNIKKQLGDDDDDGILNCDEKKGCRYVPDSVDPERPVATFTTTFTFFSISCFFCSRNFCCGR